MKNRFALVCSKSAFQEWFQGRSVLASLLSIHPLLLSWLSADWPFTSCVGRCFSVLFSTTQSLTVSLLILKPTQMKMLAYLIQNYSQTWCGSVSPEFVSPWFSTQLSGHLYEAVAITFEWAWTASLYYLPPVLSGHLKRNYLNKSKNYPSRKIWSIFSFRNQCQ